MFSFIPNATISIKINGECKNISFCTDYKRNCKGFKKQVLQEIFWKCLPTIDDTVEIVQLQIDHIRYGVNKSLDAFKLELD